MDKQTFIEKKAGYDRKGEEGMAKTASAIIAQARAWVGKKEADGTHKSIIDVYNSHKPLARGYKVKYTDAWCATFVSAVAIKCGATDIIPTECGCGQMIALFKNLGEWSESDSRTPQPGDIIFYDWNDTGSGDNTGWPDHVGIVESVGGGKITVIEGNKDNAVARRTIDVNGRYIRGYGVPKYDKEASAGTAEGTKSITEVAKEVIAGKWGNGTDRKNRRNFRALRKARSVWPPGRFAGGPPDRQKGGAAHLRSGTYFAAAAELLSGRDRQTQ